MPKRTASPNMEFAVAQLRRNPRMTFAALKAAATKKGLKVVPIVYGRAKLALGLTGAGSAPGTSASSARRARAGGNGAANTNVTPPGLLDGHAAAPGTPPPRKRGRPRRQPADPVARADGSLNLNQLLEAVRLAEAQHAALEQIQDILHTLAMRTNRPPIRRRGRPRKGPRTPPPSN